MFELLEMLTIGFVLGLTGALVPGPMLFVTIDTSLKKGWKAGPEIFVGHAILEFMVCVLIIYGITAVSDSTVMAISILGGATLVIFGLMTMKSAKGAAESMHEHNKSTSRPVLAGILTSASNPYFWIWWLAAGSALVLRGMEIGIIAAVMFMIGHWLADLGYFTVVSTSFSKGKKLMSPKVYERVLLSCGLFLVLFGSWFIIGT
ncbi:Threonine/homoserine/homoserine lactone efflux protein [Methanolobus vulcani]|jgi:threonine/homoserine/homoserine lactone efflux protein|uniref:Threonine/homoserine/homoserine lactone efflux protein n=1 Tax=Methanolobus vulcani TaxID=38026 RepID=A0A7Z7AUH8_9EURY|nr:LysE family transporter [Methanolobus vulcani]SDF31956.1 Threonine/homoserine/homoserine lactone efflux protein [Methanolobus vulcani]